MGYYVDLTTISINDYKEILKSAELIPSWKILEQDIDKNLDRIKKCNINNLDELLKALNNKDKIESFSKRSRLSQDYLAVLNRVVKGYRQKPNRIKDFVWLPESIIIKLEKLGLKNTLKLYDEVITKEKRSILASKTGVNESEILMLAKLTDLSRIRWVNHTFAYVLHESGYDTTEKVANADYQQLYETVKKLNQERAIYDAHIGVRDMKMCIEAAKSLDLDVEY